MTLLDAHLEQISLCSQSIAELPFPPPKIFTNAILAPHDITALIRDTEAHERALFSVPPPPRPQASDQSRSRRTTTFNFNNESGPGTVRAPRRNTAVAAVLGGDLVERIRRGGGGGVGSGLGYRENKTDIDVEVLLEGAEKLCGVYGPIPGANSKIASLRERHNRLTASIAHYEAKVADQAAQLSRMNRGRDFEDEDGEPEEDQTAEGAEEDIITEEDIRRDEEEVRELEAKKRGLEQKVEALGKDLTGVLQ